MRGAACSRRLCVPRRWRAGSGAVQASEDLERRRRVDDHGANHHAASTARASEAIDSKDVPEQVAPGPAPAGSIGSPPGAALGEPTPAGFRLGSRRHDLVPPCRAGTEDAVIQRHIGVWRWNQCGEALNQLQLCQPQTRCPVGPRPLEPQHHPTARRCLDAALRQGWAADVPAQPLHRLLVVPAHHDAGVNVVAGTHRRREQAAPRTRLLPTAGEVRARGAGG